MDKKIILVSILPIANVSSLINSNFTKNVKWRKKESLKKQIKISDLEKNYSQELKKEIEEFQKSNDCFFTIVNYLTSGQKIINFNKIAKKIDKIILISIPDYDLVVSLTKKFLICPFCEKSYPRSQVEKGKKFICPQEKEYEFSLEEVENFNEKIMKEFLKSNREVLEYFNSFSVPFTQITINEENELFSKDLSKKIIQIIEQ